MSKSSEMKPRQKVRGINFLLSDSTLSLSSLSPQPTTIQFLRTIIHPPSDYSKYPGPVRASRFTSQLPVQPLTHPSPMQHQAPLISLPDNLMANMVAPSDINPYSMMNASYGSAAVVDTLSPQTLDTISRDVYTDSGDSGDLWQQQQSILCENMQAHNASEHVSEANGITGSMTLEASGHTNGTSRALHWQRDDDGTLAHAQVFVEDQIRDSYVNPVMEHFPTEKLTF
jgi:hypothetical protein